jgi:threonyl-tRNA synthetase
VEVDDRGETLGKRIRDVEVDKVPYAVVWGDRETDAALAVRRRGGDEATLSLDALFEELTAQLPSS